MIWDNLYAQTRSLRAVSRNLTLASALMLIWTMVVTVATILELDELARAIGDGESGINQFQSYINPRPDFFDYVVTVGSATSTYAIVTVLLFTSGQILKALALVAEVAVLDLDLELDDGPES